MIFNYGVILLACNKLQLKATLTCTFLKKFLFIYLFLLVLGLHCWKDFSLVAKSGSSALISWLLLELASLVVECRL